MLRFLPRPGFLLPQHQQMEGQPWPGFSMPPQLPPWTHQDTLVRPHRGVLIPWARTTWTQLCLLIAASARTCKWQIHQKCFLNWTASLVSLEGPLSTGVMKPRLTNNYWTWWIEAPPTVMPKYDTTELKPTEIQIAILLKKLPQKKSSKLKFKGILIWDYVISYWVIIKSPF